MQRLQNDAQVAGMYKVNSESWETESTIPTFPYTYKKQKNTQVQAVR